MDWEEKPRFGNFLIWVSESHGYWIASVAALPRHGGMYTAGPGEEVIPGVFDTQESAEDAAKAYIIQRRGQ
jgi:hypothetical protein